MASTSWDGDAAMTQGPEEENSSEASMSAAEVEEEAEERIEVVEEGEAGAVGGTASVVASPGGQAVDMSALSKSQRRRLRKLERVRARRPEEKRRKRRRKKLQRAEQSEGPKPKEAKHLNERMEQVMRDCNAQCLVIDCSMEEQMTLKEVNKLAMQFNRLYGLNRGASLPVHLWLMNLKNDDRLDMALRRVCCGFEKYKISRTERDILQEFRPSDVIFLTPDAEEELEFVNGDSVLVLGGLVDENPKLNLTIVRAAELGVRTARLPLSRHCNLLDKRSSILPINLVGAMLLDVYAGGDWATAVRTHMPSRFVVPDLNTEALPRSDIKADSPTVNAPECRTFDDPQLQTVTDDNFLSKPVSGNDPVLDCVS